MRVRIPSWLHRIRRPELEIGLPEVHADSTRAVHGLEPMVALASGPRALVVVQVLDPRERDLSFRGKVRLRPIEGKGVVVTDADAVRKAYRERLEEHVGAFRRRLENDGGRLVRCCSTDEPVTVVRSILEAVLEARR